MAKHPAAGRSKAQIEAFERVCIGVTPGTSKRTIDALVKAGLIEQIGTEIVGRDSFGGVSVPVFDVPIHHHIAWCEWCRENMPEPAEG